MREGKTYQRGNMIVENEGGRVRVSIAFVGNLKNPFTLSKEPLLREKPKRHLFDVVIRCKGNAKWICHEN